MGGRAWHRVKHLRYLLFDRPEIKENGLKNGHWTPHSLMQVEHILSRNPYLCILSTTSI